MSSADHGSHVAEDEPKTPMWLPALGVALFLIVGIWFATRPGDATDDAKKGEAAPAATASAAPAAVHGH
ncbi:MAG: hypothetical protein U0235_14650 [Polyangiaceae bacterium]